MVLGRVQTNEPIIPFLGLYRRKIIRNMDKGTCTSVSTEVLFIIAKIINLNIGNQGKVNV